METIGDIGWAIQNYAEAQGCSVVREFVGHGVGLAFHEAPQVPHFGKRHTGTPLVPGMVFTIEPMINLGRQEIEHLPDGWTVETDRGLQVPQELLINLNAVLIVLFNLIADILYGILDPRIRYD